jgi:RNA polymerase sigma factor (TIGR02999 family)
MELPFQMSSTKEITQLLIDWSNGNATALDDLMPLVEGELRRIAANCMRRENPGHTLQTTALVNEAYLKLVDQTRARWQNRAHFFAIAARVMRRILLDHARTQRRAKRGGGAIHVELDGIIALTTEKSDELFALDEALSRLASFDPVKSKIVEMRYFGGLTVEETAEVLQVAQVTVMRHWSLAKSWLRRELRSTNKWDIRHHRLV